MIMWVLTLEVSLAVSPALIALTNFLTWRSIAWCAIAKAILTAGFCDRLDDDYPKTINHMHSSQLAARMSRDF
jgi:hypothetical protein